MFPCRPLRSLIFRRGVAWRYWVRRTSALTKSLPPETSSGSAEIEVKPDTPAISSVQSRVQQLTQGREGNAEFISRVERFITPVTPQTSPLPTKRCPLTLSDNVSNLQMKLEAGDMPSSKQALRIRQEREEELHLLSRPIAENAFPKAKLL
ncbi:hypothetical protein UPYG_G00355250 [Umbra pygmaea]|uniref:Uncharacterized protein n=1 Tax=Umbra pygmaea TaxID=75934 RepID=A0ABD0VZA1_UMBPY